MLSLFHCSLRSGAGGLDKLCAVLAILLVLFVASDRPAGAQAAAQPPNAAAGSGGRTHFKIYPNSDIDLTPFETLTTASTAKCELACRQTDGCVAYSHDVWNHICYLKDSAPARLLNARTVSGVMDTLSQPPPSENDVYLEYFNEKTFPAFGYRASMARTRDECGEICLADKDCNAFSFVVREKECRVYDATSEYVKKSGIMSGAKRQ